MNLNDYLITIMGIEKPEILPDEPAFTFSLENVGEDYDE